MLESHNSGRFTNRFNVQANAHTKIVNAIWFHPNTSISVGEIIKKYGEPDFVVVSHDKLPEGSTIQMYLYWDSNRMSVVLPKTDGDIYGIDETTKIDGAGFSDEELYQDSSEIEFGSFYRGWDGYGATRYMQPRGAVCCKVLNLLSQASPDPETPPWLRPIKQVAALGMALIR